MVTPGWSVLSPSTVCVSAEVDPRHAARSSPGEACVWLLGFTQVPRAMWSPMPQGRVCGVGVYPCRPECEAAGSPLRPQGPVG